MTDAFNALREFMARNKVTVESSFIPHRFSRNKGDAHPCLNYRVTVHHEGRGVLGTDYSMGRGFAPADKIKVAPPGQNLTEYKRAATAQECESGVAVQTRRAIKPDAAHVFHALIWESRVLDYAGFAEWAGDLGLDTDSRKAFEAYGESLVIALALRAALGDAAMKEAAELARQI